MDFLINVFVISLLDMFFLFFSHDKCLFNVDNVGSFSNHMVNSWGCFLKLYVNDHDKSIKICARLLCYNQYF